MGKWIVMIHARHVKLHSNEQVHMQHYGWIPRMFTHLWQVKGTRLKSTCLKICFYEIQLLTEVTHKLWSGYPCVTVPGLRRARGCVREPVRVCWQSFMFWSVYSYRDWWTCDPVSPSSALKLACFIDVSVHMFFKTFWAKSCYGNSVMGRLANWKERLVPKGGVFIRWYVTK